MNLFIDASKEVLSLALIHDDNIIFKSNINSHSKHSNYIMDEIKKGLNQNNVSINDIDNFIVLNGPGSFTGVRVGVVVAKTLAWVLKKNLFVVNNLESLKVGFDDELIITTIFDKELTSYVGIYDKNKSQEAYLSIDDNTLNISNKSITIVSLEENSFTKKLYEKLKLANNVKLNYINDYKYVELVNYAIKKEPINPHLAKPIYLKKIDVEK